MDCDARKLFHHASIGSLYMNAYTVSLSHLRIRVLFVTIIMAQLIELSIMRCSMNNKKCVYPNCREKHNLIHVSKLKRHEILNLHRIYIPNNCVVCHDHVDVKKWENCICLEFKYTREYIEDMIDLLRRPPKQCENKDSLFCAKKVEANTGLSLTQFDKLFNELPTLRRFFPKNTGKAKLALLMYLTRLRQGDRYNRIYANYNIGQKAGRQYIVKCRIALESDFVPKNLGLNTISRESLLANITDMANNLFLENKKDQAVVIADGTYIYCNKTQNFSKQRELYSVQKKRPLFKPMVLVTTNGRILDVFGPYKATTNDAKILKLVFAKYASQLNAKLSEGILLFFFFFCNSRKCGKRAIFCK